MKQHQRFIPEDIDEPYTCKRCGDEWPCAGVRYRQSRCGCWQTTHPSRLPWFYRPQWYFQRWSPVWLGGDQWCRRTLVIGWCLTGQIIIPLRECQGCEDCGPFVLDGVWQGGPLTPQRSLERAADAPTDQRFPLGLGEHSSNPREDG